MSDAFIGFVRTLAPLVVAGVLAWFGRRWGWVPPDGIVEDFSELLVAGIAAAYYALVRALEARWPRVGVLLGVPRTPEYPPKA